MENTRISTVLIVEDQTETRKKIETAIHQHNSLKLLGSAANAADARYYLNHSMPDVLITDIQLPDGSGIDLIDTYSSKGGRNALVVTVFNDDRHIVSAIQAGAIGYLLKDREIDLIGSDVMTMINGGSPISPCIARRLLKRFSSIAGNRIQQSAESPALTKRESEVLGLIAKGFTYSEIAHMLFLSVHTVNSHIKRLYQKLAVKSRGEAVYEATQLGLIG